MPLILKSIEEEAADCRTRCADLKVGNLILHCHHDRLCEVLTEPVENRIVCILTSKRDNPALRLRLMGPPIVDAAALADAELSKAHVELSKAYADCSKAYAELSKAHVGWGKAYAELSKAGAKWSKADAKWSKADAEWRKAYAELSKAYAGWSKAYAPHYARLYPDSPWNGKTIFAGEFAR